MRSRTFILALSIPAHLCFRLPCPVLAPPPQPPPVRCSRVRQLVSSHSPLPPSPVPSPLPLHPPRQAAILQTMSQPSEDPEAHYTPLIFNTTTPSPSWPPSPILPPPPPLPTPPCQAASVHAGSRPPGGAEASASVTRGCCRPGGSQSHSCPPPQGTFKGGGGGRARGEERQSVLWKEKMGEASSVLACSMLDRLSQRVQPGCSRCPTIAMKTRECMGRGAWCGRSPLVRQLGCNPRWAMPCLLWQTCSHYWSCYHMEGDGNRDTVPD